MSNQINEGAERYTTDKQDQSRPERSAAQRTQSPQQLVTDHLDLWTSTVTPKSTSGRGRGSGKSSKLELTGIKKLRELILELAVRGKLVAQNPDDEPASKLLERIEAEKAQLIKDGKLKKQKPVAAVTEDEKPFELSANWSWTRFGQICQHNSGKTLDSSRNSGTLRPYITTSNLYWGFFQLSEVREMPISDTELDKCQAVEGDLLICEGGEAGRAAVWESVNPVCFQNHIHRARPFGKLSPYYLFRLFQRLDLSGEIANYRKGVAISNMSGKALASIPVPLPPLAEQQRIVSKVDELMALCDQMEQQSEHQLTAHQQLTDTLLATLTESANAQELNDNWQRLANHFDLLFSGPMGAWAIDRLKDTILQLAVMGKLVPQNPEDEPASKLLEHIEEEKARLVKEGKIKKPKKLPPVSDDEKPFELPEGWEWVKLSTITQFENGDRSSRYPSGADIVSNGVPFFGAPDIIDGKLAMSHELRFITESKFSELSNGKLQDLDVVILLRGSVGKVALFQANEKYSTGFINAQMLITRLYDKVMTGYFFKYLHSSFFNRQIDNFRSGSAVQQMSASNLSNTLIPLPPLPEQQRIVAKVDKLFALCDQLKDRLQQASETEQHLTNAIVEQALG
ncbi:restriction endonuclease subunit S [Thalassolituus sp. UBA2590]|uniref:restriction endonuclease subunit S n=1 Tax=Thalassolituus sp. UBA2590 TaxID=1947663 RepID=UPI0026498631|nr:restriction endonuclease subunit S [Thalassolituus sp. UBA2590]